MFKTLTVAVTLSLTAACALAEPLAAKPVGTESKEYRWNCLLYTSPSPRD